MNRQDAEAAKNLEWEEPGEELDELAHRVIGAAIEVHRLVGPGFLETVYEGALAVELTLRGIPFARQVPIGLQYKGTMVGEARLDLVVGNCLVVELKVVEQIAPIHVAQTLSYLKATRLRLGLLLNFNVTMLRSGIQRVIHTPQDLGGLGVLAVNPPESTQSLPDGSLPHRDGFDGDGPYGTMLALPKSRLRLLLGCLDASAAIVGSALLVACTPLKSDVEVPVDADAEDRATATEGAGGSDTGGGGAGSDTGGTGGDVGVGEEPAVEPSPKDAAVESDRWVSGGDASRGSNAVLQIAVGMNHTCALLEGGRVRCWGWGIYGPLGYGRDAEDIGDDETPASAGDVDIGGKVLQLSAGASHTCAVLEGGRVRCWGWAVNGQLGYGNVTNNIGDDEVPATAGDVNVGGNVIQVAAGRHHTCALLEAGVVRCWGEGFFGALGYANTNTIGDDEVPAAAGDVNVGGKVVQIAANDYHTCARLDTGALRCWGYGTSGALGYGNSETIGDDEAPALAGSIDVGGLVDDVSPGIEDTCALLRDPGVRCWGYSGAGSIGYPNRIRIGIEETPGSMGEVDVGGSVVQVSAGFGHTCAVLDSGAVRCWGVNQFGQLGYGHKRSIGDDEAPSTAGDVKVGGKVKQIGCGTGFTCALLVNGKVRCWGSEEFGVLGYGNHLAGPIGDDEFPETVGDVPVN